MVDNELDAIALSRGNQRDGIAKLKIRKVCSRYLIIVLYLWLKKYFSRGDYQKA